MFVDRQGELDLLEQCYASGQAELFVLYGRRRVGKTELLARFCQGKRHIFYVADLDVEPVLRAGLSAVVNAELLGSQAASAVYPTWDDIFLLLAHHAKAERLVVVLDEFTYLVSAHPPLASALQRLWDSHLRHSKLMLVLCGSYVGMMEQAVLGYRAPLYGRRTGQCLLEPLGFHDARLFFPTYDPGDQVRAYAVLGGTPAYLRAFATSQPPQGDRDQPLLSALGDRILTRGMFLYDEARFLLQQELREPRNYFAVLEAIAAGHTRLNEIKQATGLDGVTAYLNTLQELWLVERAVPATEGQPHKSRRGIYRLRDNFFRFWFRFVHPNRTLLERGGSQIALQRLVSPQIDAFTGPVFEQVCQQFLWRAGMAGRLPFLPMRIGGWWQANEEIDIAAIGEQAALLVECKWTARPVGVDILRELERKSGLLASELGDRRRFLGLCARSGFTPQVEAEAERRGDLFLFDLPSIVEG